MRGHTLVETLVACSLLLLATFTVFSLWEVGGRMFTRADSQSVSQRAVLRFADRFTRETQSSTLASMTLVYPSGDPTQGDLQLAFLSAQGTDGTNVLDAGSGQPIYQAWIVYACSPVARTITRLRLALSTPSMLISALPAATIASDLAANSSSTVVQNAVSWQALDFDSGQPTASPQNPACYAVAVSSLPARLVFRNRMLQ